MALAYIKSIKSLLVFSHIYETGSATRTAKLMNITQSGVSRSLALLEASTGINLFIRRKNRLIPTPEGEEFYRNVKRLIHHFEETENTIQSLRDYGVSRIRLVTIPGLSFSFVPSVISRLMKSHKKLNIHLDSLSSDAIVSAVSSEQFDLGFVTMPVDLKNLSVYPLCKVNAVCLLPKCHKLAEKDVVNIKDLSGEHLIQVNQPSHNTEVFTRLLSQHKVIPSGKTEANMSSIASMVGHGIGLSIINSMTSFDMTNPNVVVKPFRPNIEYEFVMIYKSEWEDNKLIYTIQEAIEQELSLYKISNS